MNGQPTVFRVGASYQRGTSVATSRECFDFFYAQVEAAVNTAASGGGGTARVAASIAEALAGVKAADAVSLFVAESSVFTISKSVAALAAKVLGLGSFL